MATRVHALLIVPALFVGCSAGPTAPGEGNSAGGNGLGGSLGSGATANGGSGTTGGNASGGYSGSVTSGAGAGVDGQLGSAGTGGPSGAGGLGGMAGSATTSSMAGAAGRAATGGSTGSAGQGGLAGASASGGMSGAGAGGATSGGACASPSMSTATRPQLSSTEAQSYTIQKYLAQSGPFTALVTDNWDPTAGLGSASTFKPDFTVAMDGSGTHATLQAALNAATGTARRYILIKPGSYRGQVSYTGATPVTLYGASTDATQVVIINNLSQQSGASQTFAVKSNGFQLLNLTVSNDFPTPTSGSNIQAVALQTNSDKIVLQNVRLHGFQDTFQLQAPNATTVARVYVKDSYIEGDTDFIYGNATVVLDNTEVHYLSSRRGTGSGVMMAPSTSVANALGFLFIRCNFTAEAGAPASKVSLGRSWDTSSTTPTPNGQGVIRESTLGAHVNRTTPWAAAATSGRAYSATGNRFDEYCNSGPGAAP